MAAITGAYISHLFAFAIVFRQFSCLQSGKIDRRYLQESTLIELSI